MGTTTIFASDLDRLIEMTSYLTGLFHRIVGMKSWSVQDAKARFSEFLETCLSEGPQLVTRRGSDAAVLVPLQHWERLQHAARPTLKDLLLSPTPRADFSIPRRGSRRRRRGDELG